MTALHEWIVFMRYVIYSQVYLIKKEDIDLTEADKFTLTN